MSEDAALTLERLYVDIRYSLRQFVRNRGFTVTVILPLALASVPALDRGSVLRPGSIVSSGNRRPVRQRMAHVGHWLIETICTNSHFSVSARPARLMLQRKLLIWSFTCWRGSCTLHCPAISQLPCTVMQLVMTGGPSKALVTSKALIPVAGRVSV